MGRGKAPLEPREKHSSQQVSSPPYWGAALPAGRFLLGLIGTRRRFPVFLHGDYAEFAGAMFPTLAGEFSHVDFRVRLVNDFQSDEGFNHVLQGHQSTGAAKLVDNDGDMLVVGQQLVEQLGKGVVLLDVSDRATYLAQGGFRFPVNDRLQQIGFQNVARDVIFAF